MESRLVSPVPAFHNALLDLIESHLAIILNDHTKIDIMRVVEELQTAGEITGAEDLCGKLSKQDITQRLWQEIIRVATIGETYFFRDGSQINTLWHSILPNLIQERRQSGLRTLRIWSAGCSTGEEPYSLAIILRDLIPDIQNWDIRILATDLNSSHLERAQRGLYRSWSFRSETPPACQDQWFDKEAAGYRIDASIRRMVTFAPLNLADDSYTVSNQPVMQMDLILCRNVLIYFDKQTVNDIIKRFHGVLSENGWLVLGHSESSHMATHSFQIHNFDGAALFQKQHPSSYSTPAIEDVVDTKPVSNPKLLAPRVVQKAAPRAKAAETLVKPAVTLTDKLDPWTLAYYAANREDWAEALERLIEAENENIMRPEVHYLRGIIELQQDQIEKSLASLRRAIYCKNDFVLAHFTVGEIFEKLGHLKKAANHWTWAHQILSNLPPEQPIEFSDKLTVEMLFTVIDYRLNNLLVKSQRHSS